MVHLQNVAGLLDCLFMSCGITLTCVIAQGPTHSMIIYIIAGDEWTLLFHAGSVKEGCRVLHGKCLQYISGIYFISSLLGFLTQAYYIFFVAYNLFLWMCYIVLHYCSMLHTQYKQRSPNPVLHCFLFIWCLIHNQFKPNLSNEIRCTFSILRK